MKTKSRVFVDTGAWIAPASFAIMHRQTLKLAFAFDLDFTIAGFESLG